VALVGGREEDEEVADVVALDGADGTGVKLYRIGTGSIIWVPMYEGSFF